MKSPFCLVYIILMTTCFSCSKEAHEINLKWNKAYNDDTIERSITGLKWALSYLGSNIASDSTLKGISYKNSIITLDINQLGFSEYSKNELAKLQYIFKTNESYKESNNLDLGRYIALTFGNSYHYYAIVGVPESLEQFNQIYTLDSTKGYINNSSVSKVERIISFSMSSKTNRQGFISAELDSISKDTLEYETMEIMSNGQLKFGIYNSNGELKEAGNREITRAGKPAKCIWCHEVVVQPLFKQQLDRDGYLDHITFDDTLQYFNKKLQKYQNKNWVDEKFLNKRLHTELELLYISFMEPNLKRISKEWKMSVLEVQQRLKHLKTHQHQEFPFLGNLYHRKDIDQIAPTKLLEVPEYIREPSNNEVNLLN